MSDKATPANSEPRDGPVQPEEADTNREDAATAEAAEDPAGDAAAAQGAKARRRVTPSAAVVALLLALLGFTLVWQVRSVATDPTLASARQEELVRILADLDAHEARLRQDIAELEETRRRLTTAGESQQEALAEATRRADELGILAGTLPATGPGVRVQIRAGPEGLSAATLLDAVQELRGAGAEALQITDGNDTEVRVVGSTYFVDGEAGGVPVIQVDGRTMRSPYTITAIGDPDTLQPALTIPGGVVESVEAGDGTVTVHGEPDGVEVSAVREPATLQHAQPDS